MYQCVSAVRAVEVAVFVCLRSSCSNVTEVGEPSGLLRLALKVVIKLTGICGCNLAVTLVYMKLELSL